MIEKITNQNQIARHKLAEKINELVDAVNTIQKERELERFEIQEWIAIVSDLRSRVLVVESRVSILEEHAHPTALTPDLPDGDDAIQEVIHADPYAEQRKWIGKVCKFWDFVYDPDYFDTLKGITDDGLFIGHNGTWKHCEPVKPGDDIIFKGE